MYEAGHQDCTCARDRLHFLSVWCLLLLYSGQPLELHVLIG